MAKPQLLTGLAEKSYLKSLILARMVTLSVRGSELVRRKKQFAPLAHVLLANRRGERQ